MKLSYQETLDFLFTQLPMFQRVGGNAFKKDLTNIKALLTALNHPEQQFASIHVGGTNGKGSVTHLLGAALQASGLKTGLYTSPHYKDFRERIKVDGKYAPKAFVTDFVEQIRPLLDQIKPSFFEITVAMAFSYFAHCKVDVAVVEVGLGGRLDSTNVLLPELAVITNISLDHQQFLGDTLSAIASEKAGIIKPNIPVVIGETHKESAPVFRTIAHKNDAPLYFADQLFRVSQKSENAQHTIFEVFRKYHLYVSKLLVNLHGPYQYLNIQTALAALEVWQLHQHHRMVEFTAVQEGWHKLREMTWYQGRWQILNELPRILVDSAHNIGGLEVILKELKKRSGQLHLVLGVVNDKKLDDILPLFPTNARYYFAKADIPRGLPADELKVSAAKFGLNGRTYVGIKQALQAAKRAAQPEDTIFVGGSIFTVAEIL